MTVRKDTFVQEDVKQVNAAYRKAVRGAATVYFEALYQATDVDKATKRFQACLQAVRKARKLAVKIVMEPE